MLASSIAQVGRTRQVAAVQHETRYAIPRLPALAFGGDWNPEQWPEHGLGRGPAR